MKVETQMIVVIGKFQIKKTLDTKRCMTSIFTLFRLSYTRTHSYVHGTRDTARKSRYTVLEVTKYEMRYNSYVILLLL